MPNNTYLKTSLQNQTKQEGNEKVTSLRNGTQVCVTPYLVLFLEEVCDMCVRYYLVLQTSLKTLPKAVVSPKYFQAK